MAHFALICPQHFSHSLSFCIITGIFSFLYIYIHIHIYIFCRPTGFVSHTKHKLTLFLFLLFCCFFFFCFCFCYCYYYYCAESQPIIGALIVYMYVLYMFVLYECVVVFIGMWSGRATKSRFNFNENPIRHECRMSFVESPIVFCCCCCFCWATSYTSVFIADPIRQMRFSLRHIHIFRNNFPLTEADYGLCVNVF